MKNAYIREKIKKSCHHMPEKYKKLILSFTDHMADINLSASTITGRCNGLKVFTYFLVAEGEKRIQDVDRSTVEKYRQSLVKKGLKESTVDGYFRSVKALYGYLEKHGMIFENPFQKIVMHRPKMVMQDILTPDEVNRFLAVIDSADAIGLRNRAMIETLYATGVRREELLSLTIFDADTDNETLRVMGKGSKERVLPMGRHASKYIELYLKYGRRKILRDDIPDDENLLFVSSWANRKPALDCHFFRPVCEKAKIRKHVTCHTFRRTCATHMLQNGAHPLMVAEMLGHSSLKTLRQYLKINITELQETHSKLKPGK